MGHIAQMNMVMSSLILLFFSLGVFLVSLGIVVELIYFKGDFKIKDASLMPLNATIKNGEL